MAAGRPAHHLGHLHALLPLGSSWAPPFVETLRGNRALSAALATITAAVVGVILNLAIWFALHVLFGEVRVVRLGPATLDVPVLATLDVPALLLTALAVLAVFRLKLGMIPVLATSAGLGVLYHLATVGI